MNIEQSAINGYRDAVALLRLSADATADPSAATVAALTRYATSLTHDETRMAVVSIAALFVRNADTDGRPFDDWLTDLALALEP